MAQGPRGLNLVTILITIQIRESVPDHDPIMLAFGGGLCSLSTSSCQSLN